MDFYYQSENILSGPHNFRLGLVLGSGHRSKIRAGPRTKQGQGSGWSLIGLTGMVPAASCSASSPPGTFEHGSMPKLCGVLTEGIGCEIADLQSGELAQELLERHPGRNQMTNITVYVGSPVNHKNHDLPELSILHFTQQLILLCRVDGVPL